MNLAERPPELSVVMVVGRHRRRAERALQSVLEQAPAAGYEVILVVVTPGEYQPLEGQDHPMVQTLRAPDTQPIGELRSAGFRAARGNFVAFLEDHVIIEPGYLRSVLEAFHDGWVVVGPEVEHGNPDRGVSNAVHLLHYGLWSPAQRSGESELLPGNNSAYRKDVLEGYGARLGSLLLTDTVLQLRLRADQHRLWLESSARLRHLNATSLKTALISEYLYHRCFAASRSFEFKWNDWKRIGVLARTPLTPWVRLFRLTKSVLRRYPKWRGRLMAALPALIILQHAAAAGQFAGLVWGQGAAPAQFTRFELEYPRSTAGD